MKHKAGGLSFSRFLASVAVAQGSMNLIILSTPCSPLATPKIIKKSFAAKFGEIF